MIEARLMPADDAFAFDPGLSWPQLRAFYACFSLGSFAAAAAALGLTSAAVRHQVGLLEARLGAQLFIRQSGDLRPTPTGLAFGRDVGRPMRALAEACAKARDAGRASPLTLSVPPLFARRFLMHGGFLRWCAENGVAVDVSETKRDLDPGMVCIRLNGEAENGVRRDPLLRVSLALAAAPHAALGARLLDPGWWRDQVLLTAPVAEAAWRAMWGRLGVAEPQVAQRLQFTSYAAALDAAREGGGLVLAPLPMAEADLERGRLVRLTPETVETASTYDLLMDEKLAASPRGRALRRRIVALAAA